MNDSTCALRDIWYGNCIYIHVNVTMRKSSETRVRWREYQRTSACRTRAKGWLQSLNKSTKMTAWTSSWLKVIFRVEWCACSGARASHKATSALRQSSSTASVSSIPRQNHAPGCSCNSRQRLARWCEHKGKKNWITADFVSTKTYDLIWLLHLVNQ